MEDSSLIRRLCGLYAAMLYAYPREFRLQYGGEMQRTFRDLARRNTQSWFRFGLRNLADWIVSTMRERREARKASGTRKLVQEWAVTILLFLFVSTTMVQAYVVPTGSMENNILIGDHMLVDKVGFENGGNNWASYVLPSREVKRGDIIAFRYPEDVRQTYVKRVIGVPGDRIRLENKQVVRNGQKLEEPYARHSSAIDDYRDNFPTAPEFYTTGRGRDMFARNVEHGEVIVPPDMLFVMGDNRDNSLDSRHWGFVPKNYVAGKPLVIYWSYDAPTSELIDWNLAHMEDLALHFFTKTRWDRTLKVPRSQSAQ
jgi:signal peptidase I